MRPRLAVLACSLAMLCGCARMSRHVDAAVVVIGVDGMDPLFVQRHWEKLPNLRLLRDTGGFRPLKTTSPPQSPVAWSTFITGLLPPAHGIYDFVHRDAKTLSIYSAMNQTQPPSVQLPIGPWLLPLSSARVSSPRRGTPFWLLLSERDVPVTIMRLPTNYPPVQAGHALSGMGVPDLRGSFGTFTFYTDDPEEITRTVSGGRIVKVGIEAGRVALPLEGPPNSLRRDQRISSISVVADVDPAAKAVRLTIGDSHAVVQQGEWSEWIAVEFPLIPHVASAQGMFRVYAKQLAPRFQLYATPVNIDPYDPALPISAPKEFSREIARDTGPFFTQGIAEDTSALRQGAFNLSEYLSQARLVLDDERRLLRYALRHFSRGLLFFYFSVIDQNSHILWRRHEAELLETYRAVDDAIGEAMRSLPGALIIVMSDHGFTHFDRSFHLNAWLRENGYLALSGPGTGEGFVNVDWSRTRAYGVGLNGLYLNQQQRETQGIVAQRDRAALLKQITEALLAVRDPATGAQVVRSIEEPPPNNTAPDLIVGYAAGYRASWDTGLGASGGTVIQDNNDAWIGDHCVDAALVPGVLFSSRPLRSGEPELRDLPVTILQLFGAKPAASMQGRSIF